MRIQASYRKQRTRILSLRHGDSAVSSEAAMAEAAFQHFLAIIGSADACDYSLDLDTIDPRSFDLSSLEQPFTEEEVWSAIKQLPTSKSPGPDGFSTKFLCCCWDVVKGDIMDAFAKLYHLNGRGFRCLNEVFITLLPKRTDAAALGDYRLVSLIHLMAKLLTKVLSLRLVPRLNELVSLSQSAFISGRCIHDNFMLVQQMARYLHHSKANRILLKLDIDKGMY